MKSLGKKMKVFIEIIPFKCLFLNNKVPQVLCRVYHTVTELAVCEPPTSFCGYEKKNLYCTVHPKKRKSMNSLLHEESLLKRSQGPHVLSTLLSHTWMKSLSGQLLLLKVADASQVD